MGKYKPHFVQDGGVRSSELWSKVVFNCLIEGFIHKGSKKTVKGMQKACFLNWFKASFSFLDYDVKKMYWIALSLFSYNILSMSEVDQLFKTTS